MQNKKGNSSIIAGNGNQGFFDGPALNSTFGYVTSMVYDNSTKTLFFLDSYNLRKLFSGYLIFFSLVFFVLIL